MAERRGSAGGGRRELGFLRNLRERWEHMGTLAGTGGRNGLGADERCRIAVLIPGFHPRV